VSYAPAEAPQFRPEDIPLSILYEDGEVLVVDKAQGMVVHPGAGNFSGTLVQALLFRLGLDRAGFFQAGRPGADKIEIEIEIESKSKSENEGEGEGEDLRPGIVHRLDKDTSGVIITAKNPRAQEFLAAQFRDRRVKKEYLAVVRGRLFPLQGRVKNYLIRDPANRKKFTWNDEGRGRPACTDYRVLKTFERYTLALLRPRTGRTHQLRVHMLALGHPIAGDPLYSRGEPGEPRLMLHAFKLGIRLPGEFESRVFTAPLPERFKTFLKEISKNA
jgi:23S rRNA pseudouridine1911/1915/1917 synthase